MKKKHFYKKRKKRISKNRFFWKSIGFFLFCFGIFYLICFSPFFQIKKISIEPKENPLNKTIFQIIKEKSERKIFLFTTKSLFLANTSFIEKNILENFPQIKKIKIKKVFPSSLKVKIEKRKPFAKFCNKEKKECYVLDEEGVLFSKEKEKGSFFEISTTNPPQEIKLGEEILPKNIVKKILNIKEALNKNFNISLKEVNIFSSQKVEFKTSEGWKIYFNFERNLKEDIWRAEIVLKILSPEKLKKLNYIDLRFKKVYISPPLLSQN